MNKLALLVFTIAAISAYANDIAIENSTIKSVWIYQSGAQITREHKLHLKEGKNSFVFENLTSKAESNSVNVKLQNNEATIVSVLYEISMVDQKKNSQEAEGLSTKRLLLSKQVDRYKAKIKVYEEEKELILVNRSIKSARDGLQVEDLQKMAEFYRTRLSEIEENIFGIEDKVEELQKEMVSIARQLNEMNARQEIPTGKVKLVIDSPKEQDAKVIIKYVVFDAGWEPFYNLRVDNTNEPLKLVYKAKVRQNTNEDWSNVELKLSTGDLRINKQKPTLLPYRLSYNNYYKPLQINDALQGKAFGVSMGGNTITGTILSSEDGMPLPGATIQIEGTARGTVSDLNGNFSIDCNSPNDLLTVSYVGFNTERIPVSNNNNVYVELSPDIMALEEVVVVGYGVQKKSLVTGSSSVINFDKSYSGSSSYPTYQSRSAKVIRHNTPLAVQKQVVNTSYNIKVPYDIPANNKTYDVDLMVIELPTSYEYHCVPKLSNKAFLMARISDWEKFNLKSGEAIIFYNGEYVGNTLLEMDSFNDTINISVGTDNDIVIERILSNEHEEEKFGGSNKIVQKEWEIKLRNNKPFPVTLNITDQVPVSTNDDIKTNYNNISNAELDEKSGLLSWRLNLDAHKNKNLLVNYEVKYNNYSNVIID